MSLMLVRVSSCGTDCLKPFPPCSGRTSCRSWIFKRWWCSFSTFPQGPGHTMSLRWSSRGRTCGTRCSKALPATLPAKTHPVHHACKQQSVLFLWSACILSVGPHRFVYFFFPAEESWCIMNTKGQILVLNLIPRLTVVLFVRPLVAQGMHSRVKIPFPIVAETQCLFPV